MHTKHVLIPEMLTSSYCCVFYTAVKASNKQGAALSHSSNEADDAMY
jgi:hypothetical protein